jgi:hypothetical protein
VLTSCITKLPQLGAYPQTPCIMLGFRHILMPMGRVALTLLTSF